MIKLLTAKISFILLTGLAAFILYLWQNNHLLLKKNTAFKKLSKEQSQTISTQKKVLAVVKNIKSTNLAGNIKRMQNGEL